MRLRDWFVVYDEKKKDYFAIEDKHSGATPHQIGGNEVVGMCSFKHAGDAIDYIKFIHASQPFNGKRMRRRK